MRLVFAIAVFVVAVGPIYAEWIDLHKPVRICSATMLVEVINNVCQTPLTAARRRRRSLRDSDEMIDGVVRSTRRSMEKHAIKLPPNLVRDFANTCCYTPCRPYRFIDIC
ncbi:hypothetical protein MRX96_025543 [Rhipicephalus microplus]|uniref:uncharacterized protein LOC119165739 n=1 Tax=Rhipicephalus microplus TaxID=6941 RepID=UPI002376574E|nr:gonadulin [Rhipicephalus microplus]